MSTVQPHNSPNTSAMGSPAISPRSLMNAFNSVSTSAPNNKLAHKMDTELKQIDLGIMSVLMSRASLREN